MAANTDGESRKQSYQEEREPCTGEVGVSDLIHQANVGHCQGGVKAVHLAPQHVGELRGVGVGANSYGHHPVIHDERYLERGPPEGGLRAARRRACL